MSRAILDWLRETDTLSRDERQRAAAERLQIRPQFVDLDATYVGSKRKNGGDRVKLDGLLRYDPWQSTETRVEAGRILDRISNPRTRRIFERRFVQGWSNAEIGKSEGVTESNIWQMINRKMRRLRQELSQAPRGN